MLNLLWEKETQLVGKFLLGNKSGMIGIALRQRKVAYEN
jgi:hypothetical protein